MYGWIRPVVLGVTCAALVACSVVPQGIPMPLPFTSTSAIDLASGARAVGSQFKDETAAEQAGFVALNANKDQGIVLYRNPTALEDGRTADAVHPEGLLYGHVGGKSALLGLLYLAPSGQGPDVEGATWTRLDSLLANQRMVPAGVPDAVQAMLTSYDALVVWMFDHPSGQYSTTFDKAATESALQYAAGVAVPAPQSESPAVAAKPAVSGTPSAMPSRAGVQNRRSTVGSVVSLTGSTLIVDTGNGTRQFTVAPRATVSIWGDTTTSGSLRDVKVGSRVSVGTPSAQRPELAATIVVLSQP